MKKLALALLLILLLPLSALAEENRLGLYVGAKAGASVNKLDAGAAGSGHYAASSYGMAFGYDFSAISGPPLRLELEGAFRGGDRAASYDSTLGKRLEMHFSLAFMLQGWLDLPVSPTLKPYIGGGFGLAMAEYEARRGGEHEKYDEAWGRVWMLGGGVNWKVLGRVWLDLGYRYSEADHFETDFNRRPDYDFEIRAHDVQVGVRFVF